VALAKARLAALASDASSAPAATERVAALVRTRPWRGVGIALAIGLTLGASRGRGVRAVGRLVGPLGAALATGFLRQVALDAASPRSALDAKIAEVRSRPPAR
jgi:hypothetical protein